MAGTIQPQPIYRNGYRIVGFLANGTGTANDTFPFEAITLVDATGAPLGVLPVGGTTASPSATFTRPANTTAYALGQLVANSTTAGSVAPLSWTVARVAAGSGLVRRLRLQKSGTVLTSASFRLHLYSASPTPANGDGAAWSTSGSATYLGSIDVNMDKAFTDGATGTGLPSTGSEINFALASGQTIYGLLEARASYTPASAETFTATLEVLQN